VVAALKESQHQRFCGMLSRLHILTQSNTASSGTAMVGFGDDLYLVACVLDPSYGFLWLDEDHPGDAEAKSQIIEDYITGNS